MSMEDALEGNNLHKPGTLIITVAGPMAYKAILPVTYTSLCLRMTQINKNR
jgi:hypothetical protein